MTHSAGPPLVLEAWVAFLRAHSRVVPRVSQELEARCGISLVWYDVLFQLSVVSGSRRRMQDLADAVLLSKSGLTRLVDRIEAAGLVSRAAVPGDRRSLDVRLTPAGRRLIGKARPVVRQLVADSFGRHLSAADLATLRDSLSRVAQPAGQGRPIESLASADCAPEQSASANPMS